MPRRQGVVAVAAERLADGLHDAAPVGVAAVERRLDERRVGDGAGDRLGLRPSSLAPVTVSLIVRVEPSPSATMERASASSAASERLAEPRQPLLPGPHARGAVAEAEDRVVGRLLAVHGDAVEGPVDGAVQQLRPGGLAHDRVAGDEAQHRRHVGADHAAALGGEPELDLALAAAADLEGAVLGVLVGGADGGGEVLGGLGVAAAGQRGRGGGDAGLDLRPSAGARR